MRNTIYHDLGLMNYQEVYDIQEKYFNELIDKKLNHESRSNCRRNNIDCTN